MWNLLRHVTWPQWRQHRLRTALTAVGIMLGVSVIIAMRLVNHSVFASVRESVADTAGRATLSIANGTACLPESLLDEVRALPTVKSAAALILDSGLVIGSANAGERLQVFGVDYLADTEIRSYELEKDAKESEIEDPIVVLSQPSSIFVTRRFAQSHGLALNSPLKLQVTSGPVDLVVRGILKESGPAKAYGGMFALMDIFAAQIAFGKGTPGVPGKFDQIDVVLKDGVSFEDGKASLVALVAGRGHVDRPEGRGEQIEGLLGAMKLGFSQSQALSFIVGMFLIYNTMSIAVVQRRREIGVLRSLGATAPEIRRLFVTEALVLAAIGCVAGVGLGWWMARLILPAMEKVLATMVTRTTVGYLRLDPLVIAMGVGAGFGFALVASLMPAIQAGRVSPLVALRRDAATRVEPRSIRIMAWLGVTGLAASIAGNFLQSRIGANWLSLGTMGFRIVGVALLMPWLVVAVLGPARRVLGALFGIQGKLAGDNLTNAPGRTAVTLTAVMIGISAYVIVGALVESLQVTLGNWIDRYISADLSIAASSRLAGPSSNRIPDEVVEGLRGVPGIETVKPFRYIELLYQDELAYLLTLDLEAHGRRGGYQMVSGPDAKTFMATLARGEGVGVSDAFALHFGKNVGDTLTLNTPTGPHDFRIIGTFADWAGKTGTVHIDRALYQKVWNESLVDGIDIDLAEPSRWEEVAREIRARFGAKYDLQVMTSKEFKDEIRTQIIAGFEVSKATEVIVLIISALGIVNTLLAAILDRTREIGILRAVGATRRQIEGAVLAEAGLLGAMGALIGLALGLANAYPFVRVSMLRLVGWHLDFHLDVWALAGAGIAAVAISMLAGLHPARQAGRLNILDAIEYE
ncbi:MAG: FtsX-like permease family protein [bacterium]